MAPPAAFVFATVRPPGIWTAGLPDTCRSSLEWAPPQAPSSLGLPLIFRSPPAMDAFGGRPGTFLSHASISLTELLCDLASESTLIRSGLLAEASRVTLYVP